MFFRNSLIALTLALLSSTPAGAGGDLERAYRIIFGKQFIDLTHSFGPTTPVWSGFGQADFTPAFDPKTKKPYTIKDDGFRTTYYNMVGQYGTHVDPPAHFTEDGITMDKIPLKQMILPLVVLDNTPYQTKDDNHAFSVADLKAWEKETRKGAAGIVRRAAHRHVQGLGQESRALQTRAIPGLVLRDHQVSLRAARRDSHRPRVDGYRHLRQDGFRGIHPSARPLSNRGYGRSGQSAAEGRAHRRHVAEGA